MANPFSGAGQLQRAGVTVLQSSKSRKKKFPPNWSDRQRKMHGRIKESRIRESSLDSHVAFLEQGQDTVSRKDGKKVKNRVYLVTIIEEGLGNSKDKNFYSGEAMTQGTKLFNGAKSYADHPDAISEKTLPERSMKDLVGWYSDCFTDKNPKTNGVRLRGKLHFFPAAKWLTDMIDTILTDPTAKGLFGISINAIGKTRPAQMKGEMVNYVESFQRVDSADVVTEPAARGRFEKILESRGGVRSRMVNSRMRNNRMREAGLSPKVVKQLADEATAAYNSDDPDEMKQALYDVQKELYPLSSISGKGPGQSNEEQYSNVNPAGGSEMSRESERRVRTSQQRNIRRPVRARRRGIEAQETDGTGPDNETLPEPDPGDAPRHINKVDASRRGREADVEDEENKGDLGDFDDYGDSSKKTHESRRRKVRASSVRPRVARPAQEEGLEEDEGLEGMEGMEDEGMEGMEDEGFEDENVGMGNSAGGGGGMPAPSAMGPGSSRMSTAEAGSSPSSGSDSHDGMPSSDSGIDDDLGEAEEGSAMPPAHDRGDHAGGGYDIEESRRRRESGRSGKRRRRTSEAAASFQGGLGHSGHDALPEHAGGDPDYEEDYTSPDRDTSTSAKGKSYKLKTSVGRTNRPVHPKMVRKMVTEANRRIEILEKDNRRLRESRNHKEEIIGRYQGLIRFHNSKITAKRLLESAVRREWLPEGYADALAPKLFGRTKEAQIREIKLHARLLESTREAVADGSGERLLENVDGVGARGGAVSRMGSAASGDSELIESMRMDGIPFQEQEE